MKLVFCRSCQEYQTFRIGGINNELFILDHHFNYDSDHLCVGSGHYATDQPFEIPLLPCPVCKKEFYNTHPECGLFCDDCLDQMNEAQTPKMNTLDKIIVALLGKYATFRSRTTGGPDPYGGHQLELFSSKKYYAKKYIVISNIISWSVQIGAYWYTEDDRFVMWIAQRIFEAFDTREEVRNFNTPNWVWEAERSYYGHEVESAAIRCRVRLV